MFRGRNCVALKLCWILILLVIGLAGMAIGAQIMPPANIPGKILSAKVRLDLSSTWAGET